MKRACRLWTPEEIATLRRDWVKGAHRARSYARRRALAEKLGRSLRSVEAQAERMGLAHRSGHMARRSGYDWTPAEDETLRSMWGEYNERSIRERLGRTGYAIIRRASLLGLPPQAKVAGRDSLHVIAERLGVSDSLLRGLLRDFGVEPARRAWVAPHDARYRHMSVEYDQVEALYKQLLTRASRRIVWCRDAHVSPKTLHARMVRAGVGDVAPTRPMPTGVFVELRAGVDGPWLDAWRRASTRGAGERGAAWLVALAIHDTLYEPDAAAREWLEWLPQDLHADARRLAGAQVPRGPRIDTNGGPTLVRAAGSEALRDGTARRDPAVHTSTGTLDEMDERRSA